MGVILAKTALSVLQVLMGQLALPVLRETGATMVLA